MSEAKIKAHRRQGQTGVKSVGVIGAGWAGCAAAVELARRGYAVTLFEAARTLGGRARQVEIHGKLLDNGQHILLGAYRDTLRLMHLCGIDSKTALLRLPLQMRYPADSGGMDFIAPRLPAPLHMLVALLRATGLVWEDKQALARFSTTARWMGWRLDTDCSVAELLHRFDQTPRLIQLMWRPLCIAALNTPPEHASAQVFLSVLQDSLGAKRAASDMLLPRIDLTALLPQRAAALVQAHGGSVRTGTSVERITRTGVRWQASGQTHPEAWASEFDGIVLAMQASHTARFLADLPETAATGTQLDAFHYEAISTCYLQYPPQTRLDLPFFALLDDAATGCWGQFVFDRGQLDAQQAGLFAVVVSASGAALAMDHPALADAIGKQLAAVFKRPELAQPEWFKIISEKRATFACTPALQRPDNATGLNGLVLAGDYTKGDYPATLEAAVRSGVKAAKVMATELK